jgi:plasmid stabilization system protein ParE
MSYTIRLRAKAVAEFEEACRWYNERSEQTGENFKKAFRERLYDISENAEAYSIRFKKETQSVRAVTLKNFPYLIFYIVNNPLQSVRIIAVCHEAKDRDVLKRRF